ncbi:hypothetical protein KSP40_PGU011487 [Platanthera guangdongensis]|uniref:BRCT domain-containing protein n=1 Tax=Platanthera guangdongensis TaxID=2320717 RepID=A0ABR2M7C1_9ASPA
MLQNIIVEELGGSVTSSGNYCTHVITGKARRTLNFCLALCSGLQPIFGGPTSRRQALWIQSTSVQKNFPVKRRSMVLMSPRITFADESQHILDDGDYQLKYKCRLRDAVARAKSNPYSLFKGYQVSLSKHIQPSVNELSLIIFSAGGIAIRDLRSMVEPAKTIFISCEEDMEEALLAAKMGVRTFTSDWLMNCVMTQELDLDAHQFAESL